MPLTNFGSVLGFALEIEKQNAVFFSDAAGAAGGESDNAVFETLVKNSQKRIKEIERTRRENVTEMILENIEGFTKAPFVLDPGEARTLSRDEIITTAQDLLNRSIRYYEEAGLKLKRLTEVARALKGLVKKTKRDVKQVAGLRD
jgi:hypothetical protein